MLSRKLLFFLLLAMTSFAQNSRYDNVALGPKGSIPFAQVAVCTQPANTTTTPCSPLANLCSSLTDVVCTQPNPVTADSLGNYHFYYKNSQAPFTFQLYGSNVAQTLVLPDQATPPGSLTANNVWTGTNSFKSVNNRWYADQFAGATADVQINAAITQACASANAAGIVDATGYSGTSQTIANPIIIGSSSCSVTLLVDRNTTYNVTINNASTDAMQLWSRSALVCLGDANAQNYTFGENASTVVNTMLATYPRNNQWVGYIEGCTFKGNLSATTTTAMVDITGATGYASMQGTTIYNFANTIGLHLTNNSGVGVDSFLCNNCQVNGSGLTGARPVKIEAPSSTFPMWGITFLLGTLVHPGSGGIPVVDVEGLNTGITRINGMRFYGTRIEAVNANDVGILLNNVTDAIVSGVTCTTAGAVGAACVQLNTSGGGATYDVTLQGVFNNTGFTNTLTDSIDSVSITDSRIANWVMMPLTDNSYQVYRGNGGQEVFAIRHSTDDVLVHALTDSNQLTFTEGTAPSGTASAEVCYGDSTAHALKCSYNNATFYNQTLTIGSGTAAMTTAAIGAGACGTTVTVAASGVTTGDTITWAFNAAPAGTNAGVVAWPTANNVNFAYCPGVAETPAAATINWRVVR